ncbi:MAG: lipase family protein [Hyphomicrobiales bacterium]|nr:lipase family protein [Hyphomicrobiales bacterium]
MSFPILPIRLTFAMILVSALALTGCSNTSKTNSETIAISASKTSKISKPSRSTKARKKTRSSREIASHVNRTGEIILLRGLANVYSRGMDVIGDRLKAKGVDARVYNHRAWENLAIDIVARSKEKNVSYPIIIMGHSLGGNASVQMASYLGKRDIPVSYVVAFDPTVTTFAGPKVKKVVNYYLPNGKNTVRKGQGFSGKLSNINVSNINGIKHTTVEKTRKLQNQAINTVMKLVRKRRRHG